jgi:hypothetical protein
MTRHMRCVVAVPARRSETRRVGTLTYSSKRASNGIQVDQGGTRKAKQKPEGEMERTKTTAASEAR